MKKFAHKALSGLALAGLLAGTAMGASQGDIGRTSSGSVDIKAKKSNSVRISGLNDLTFPDSISTPTTLTQSACIFATGGSYTIKATGAATAFQLTNGTNLITYTVGWYSAATGGVRLPLIANAATVTQTGANTTSSDCSTGTPLSASARFDVTIDNTSFTAAPAGNYADTLTLVLAPVCNAGMAELVRRSGLHIRLDWRHGN